MIYYPNVVIITGELTTLAQQLRVLIMLLKRFPAEFKKKFHARI